MSKCPSVKIAKCPSVQVPKCPSAHVSPSAQVSKCPSAKVPKCPSVQVSKCTGVQVSKCPARNPTRGARASGQSGFKKKRDQVYLFPPFCLWLLRTAIDHPSVITVPATSERKMPQLPMASSQGGIVETTCIRCQWQTNVEVHRAMHCSKAMCSPPPA